MDDNEAFVNSVDPVLDCGLIRFYTFFAIPRPVLYTGA